ncbi:protocadherin Fat 4-like [Babylonia areolata]|uniref:protocadherin Fat 4-like n=1 Tax=Babylonia areolata TaxID=304850 RepID=UPI003FCFB2CA
MALRAHGEIRYEAIGVYPATTFFAVDPVSGAITVTTDLKNDALLITSYTLRCVAYDNAYASTRATAEVTIEVVRNENGPIFQPSATYQVTVSEQIALGTVVQTVTAIDRDDGDVVTFTLLESTAQSTSINATLYFFLDRETGEIRTRRPLTEAPLNLYTLTVRAEDNRGRSNLASVRVIITRITDNPPVFQNIPYRTSVDVNRAINSTIYRVSAVDPDGTSPVRYNLIGYFPGTLYFSLNTVTGDITLVQSFDTDVYASLLYVLRVEAYEVLRPEVRVEENVLIDVIRNPSPPVFSRNFYTATIAESVAQGTLVLQVSADDADGDVPLYEIDSTSQAGTSASNFFYLNPSSGVIFVRNDLRTSSQNQYTFTVRARDQSYPERQDTASVQINIIRDQFAPQFSLQDYRVTISETSQVNSTLPIITVTATDRDLQERISYTAVGDGSALAFFSIDNVNGGIFVRNPLTQDSLITYTLRLEAIDTFYPNNVAVANVFITVIRNPSGPQFVQAGYVENVAEYEPAGAQLLVVTAVDQDGDIPSYRLLNIGECLEYFYISPDTGAINLRKSLFANPTNQYVCIVQASDQRSNARLTNATVTINVIRSQPPRFQNTPYTFTVSERAAVGASIYRVSAFDSDLKGALLYDVVGVAPAPSYFQLNTTTGVISPRVDLKVDTTQNYLLRVRAFDSAFPTQVAETDVSIFVLRNDNPPIFQNEPYSVFLDESFPIGQSVENVLATDADGDKVRYDLLGEAAALDYFYLNPDTGAIFLTRALSTTTTTFFTLSIRATDQRVPERTDDTTVQVTVSRNQFPPVFTDEPYRVTIPETTSINATIFTVSATDQDLRDRVVYETVGVYPAQSFFQVDYNSGAVYIIQDLKNDERARTLYTLRVIAYDASVPTQRDTADVTIAVARNLNAPVFTRSNYVTTVDESYALGKAVVNATAIDADIGDTVSYAITGASIDSIALSFFYIDNTKGVIYLRRPLTESTNPQFTFSVLATDSGRPARTTTAGVTVLVTRDQFAPEFVSTPYSAIITENASINSTVLTVRAVDQDLEGQIVYSVVGVPPAPTFFAVNPNTGAITVRGDLKTDLSMSYVLRVRAVDNANPLQYDEEDVTITIRRNVNGPVFTRQTYTVQVSEQELIGSQLLDITATDADLDRLTYTITNDARCQEVFYIAADTGVVFLKELLLDAPENLFTCTVTVSDNGYPTAQVAQATLLVGVTRDTSVPVFTENAVYSTTVPENVNVASSLLTVRATRANLVGRIFYEVVGDYPAPSFFDVNNVTGEVRVVQDLRADNLRLAAYTLRIRAYDTAASYLTATAEVFITVLRNLNRPVFFPSVYRKTVREDIVVDTYIEKLNVSDPDGNTVTCQISGDSLAQRYFAIDPTTCLISVRESLENDLQRTTEYTISVTARDNAGSNQQFASASVIVTVLRDLFSPLFSNLPSSVALNEQQAVDRTVFTATATDADLEGVIRYELAGIFPVQSFFEINEVTGELVLRNSLLSDGDGRQTYTARIQAYDTVYPDKRAEADLVINVVRNANGPSFSSGRYEYSIAETFPVGDVIGTPTATDADGDKIIYTNLGTPVDQDLFYLSPDSGTIVLKSSLQSTTRSQYTFDIQAADDRAAAIQKTVRATVIINVLRDSGPPVFQNTPYEVPVPLTQAVNTTVITVLAIDPDLRGNIRYRLEGFQPGLTYFTLNENTGAISVRQPLTRNSQVFASYTLLVTARDTGNPDIVVSELVKINVLRNLFPPVFSQNTYSASVYDFEAVGSSVLKVDATDSDITDPENQVTFEIDANAPANEFFNVDPFTGLIRISKDLTASVPSVYNFRVIARDLGALSKTSTASVVVTILRNTGRPAFVQAPNADVVVSEAISVLSTIVTVKAVDSDPDTTPNGIITYSIVSDANTRTFFQIDPVVGNISARVSLTTAPLDVYRLTVRASDQGIPTQSSEITVTIRIRREGNPAFSQSEYVVTLPEDTPLGTSIIQVTATDPLARALEYEITGDGLASTLFRLDVDTALITLAQSLRSDDANSFVIRLVAFRVDDNSVRTTVIIRVLVTRNANDPSFLHGDISITLNEDQPLGVAFLKVNATDSDSGENGAITYNIDGEKSEPTYVNQYFYVNPTSGALAVSSRLSDDTNMPVLYVLYVVATDNGVVRRSSFIRVRVTVVRNRNGPVFSQSVYNVTVDETIGVSQSLVRVTASDADADRITFSMLSSVPASIYFDVDSSSGIVRVRNSLLLDSTTLYTMDIQAVDSPVQGASPRSALAQVIVNVRRNPNTPVFDQDSYNVTVSEYLPVRSVVQQVLATDADPANTPSGQLQYSIVSVSYPNPQFNIAPQAANFFIASPTSGDIILAQQLAQARVPDVFYITIEASDSAIPPKSARATLTVNIVRNIHRPTFTELRYGATIEDSWAVGRTLFTVTAVDKDDSEPFNRETNNAYFDYIIDENYPLAETYFGVTLDGVVYVRNNLLLDDTTSYFFYIIAIDRSWQPLSSRAPVTVNVTKTNVVRTIGFTSLFHYWQILETTEDTVSVSNEYILDIANIDQGRNFFCNIVLINGVGVFDAIFTTRVTSDKKCIVTREKILDREQTGFYNLTIQVGYSSIGKRSVGRVKRQIENVYNTYSYTYLLVSVLDVNDNAPQFMFPVYPQNTAAVYVFAVSSVAEPGTFIGQVMASDPDDGSNGDVSVQLSQTNNNPFYLDGNGNLYNTIRFGMQNNMQSRYVLSATATDNGVPAQVRATDVHVNIIVDKNRFILVLDNVLPNEVVPFKESLRQDIQAAFGQIAIIESIQQRLVVTSGELDIDLTGTDVVFVLADYQTFLLYENTALDVTLILQTLRQNINVGRVVEIRKPFDLTVVTGLSQRLSDSAAISDLGQFAFSIGKPMTKSHVWWTDDPWSALVALGGIVIVLGIVALIVIVRSYTRYNSYMRHYRVYHATMASADFTEPPSFLREYETQSLNMYVPPDETVQELGEINMAYQQGGAGAGATTSSTVQNPVYGKVLY